MALADHSTLGVPGLLSDVCDDRTYDLVISQSVCKSKFVTASKLFGNPLFANQGL